MNEWNIIYSIFKIVDGDKIDHSRHYSNCRATITGNSYDEALKYFKEEKKQEGWYALTMEEILNN